MFRFTLVTILSMSVAMALPCNLSKTTPTEQDVYMGDPVPQIIECTAYLPEDSNMLIYNILMGTTTFSYYLHDGEDSDNTYPDQGQLDYESNRPISP